MVEVTKESSFIPSSVKKRGLGTLRTGQRTVQEMENGAVKYTLFWYLRDHNGRTKVNQIGK